MSFIYGVRWYTFLKSDDGKKGLFSYTPRASCLNKCLVCWDCPIEDGSRSKRYYALFENYLHFAKLYFMVMPHQRTFYEVILGESIQKPHFDLDIIFSEDLDEEAFAENILSKLLSGIVETLPEIIPCKDLCIYTSHGYSDGKIKKSYHVVVNHYYHSNNQEAKAFYHAVVAKLPEEVKQHIDHSVYSSTQQFRMLGCKKIGTERTKKLTREFLLNGEKVIREFGESLEGEDSKMQFMIMLEESLVTARVSTCKPLPKFTSPETENTNKTYESLDISKEMTKEALDLLATYLKTSVDSSYFPFVFDKVDGSFVLMKRRKPSPCKLCRRVHHNENPYLIIAANYTVFYHCRRAPPNKKLCVGVLKEGLVGLTEVESKSIFDEVKDGKEEEKEDKPEVIRDIRGVVETKSEKSEKAQIETRNKWMQTKLDSLKKMSSQTTKELIEEKADKSQAPITGKKSRKKEVNPEVVNSFMDSILQKRLEDN